MPASSISIRSNIRPLGQWPRAGRGQQVPGAAKVPAYSSSFPRMMSASARSAAAPPPGPGRLAVGPVRRRRQVGALGRGGQRERAGGLGHQAGRPLYATDAGRSCAAPPRSGRCPPAPGPAPGRSPRPPGPVPGSRGPGRQRVGEGRVGLPSLGGPGPMPGRRPEEGMLEGKPPRPPTNTSVASARHCGGSTPRAASAAQRGQASSDWPRRQPRPSRRLTARPTPLVQAAQPGRHRHRLRQFRRAGPLHPGEGAAALQQGERVARGLAVSRAAITVSYSRPSRRSAYRRTGRAGLPVDVVETGTGAASDRWVSRKAPGRAATGG